jgi:hypothetical protein
MWGEILHVKDERSAAGPGAGTAQDAVKAFGLEFVRADDNEF